MSIHFREYARKHKKKIMFCEPDERIVQAARRLTDEGLCEVILIGERTSYEKFGVSLSGMQIVPVDPSKYYMQYFEIRKHKGISESDARKAMEHPAFYACMMLYSGEADGLVCGASWPTADTIRPALHILREGIASSYFLMKTNLGNYIFADCAFNIHPDAEQLGEIAVNTAIEAEKLGFNPHIAMLSFSTMGSAHHEDEEKVVQATNHAKERFHKLGKDYHIEGEVQVDAAMDEDVSESKHADEYIHGHANVFIFPNLDAGNIGYKLVQRFTGCKAIGPIMTGFKKPVNDLSRGCSVDEIVDLACVTAWQSGELN